VPVFVTRAKGGYSSDIFASSKEVITQIIPETVTEYREQPAENFVQQFRSQFVIESKTEVPKTPKCSTIGLRNLHEFTYYREKAGDKLSDNLCKGL
jgi:hypothetical protein